MNAQRWAAIVIVAGLLLAGAALTYLPLSPWAARFRDTGTVGDTIGGIVGPVLNFIGLLVLYFSLREQFAANQIQIQELTAQRTRATNEANFNMTLLLLDKLILAAKESQIAIHAYHKDTSGITRGDDRSSATRIFLERQFLNTSYLFTYVANTVEKDDFTSNQLKVISGLLLSFYKPYLDYMQEHFRRVSAPATAVEQQIHLIVNEIRFKANQEQP
jgi:hypothetical protein